MSSFHNQQCNSPEPFRAIRHFQFPVLFVLSMERPKAIVETHHTSSHHTWNFFQVEHAFFSCLKSFLFETQVLVHLEVLLLVHGLPNESLGEHQSPPL